MAATNQSQDDPFDSLLNLEAKYHAEGYATGLTDGARAGRIEGRTFGLEKGFEKAIALGRLGGRAEVWNARTKVTSPASGSVEPLKTSSRLDRNLERLRELADPESLSTVNDEENVNAFDDRLREAKAKATLIGKMVGERDGEGTGEGTKKGREMEDFAGLRLPAAKKVDGGGPT